MATSPTAATLLPQIQRLYQEQGVLFGEYTEASTATSLNVLALRKMSDTEQTQNLSTVFGSLMQSVRSKDAYDANVALMDKQVQLYVKLGGDVSALAKALFPTNPAAQSDYQKDILDSRRVTH